MKKLIILLFCPIFAFSQNECGSRPTKPAKTNAQSIKDYKNSKDYLLYKQKLKDWKHCVSPLGISERINNNLDQGTRGPKQVLDPCGDKPEKPKREKNQSIDEYRKTKDHIVYRQKLKEWKKCMSPINDLQGNANFNIKAFKENLKALTPCGEKPQKPIRAEGLNHEEYRQAPQHIAYRQKLKEWRLCVKQSN